MTVILAVLRESWLSLRAERLFRVVLMLNVLVIAAYASLGFTETGFTLFYGLFEEKSDYIHEGSALARTLYLGIYSAFIVNLWLAWAASILAMISTSSIFPKFLSEGSVELVMSRPASRTMVFMVKYLSGLIFVMLQVAVFTIGAFFAAGWRIGEWDPAIFLAIPIVTLFYSYLFSVNVLAGVITRSTLVALLTTLLFWFGTFAIRTADDQINQFWIMSESTSAAMTEELAELDAQLNQAMFEGNDNQWNATRHKMQATTSELLRSDEVMEKIKPWRTALGGVRTVLPETARTLGLLHRELERDSEVTLMDLISGRAFEEHPQYPSSTLEARRASAEEQAYDREMSIPGWKIIGKSVAFEFVILGAGLWIFRRRDF